MVVVLPEPFGPRNPCTSPGPHLEVEAVEGHERAEGLAEPADVDDVFQDIDELIEVRGLGTR